jgi:hypothetical protein
MNLLSFFKRACLVVLMVACLFSSQVLLAANVQAEANNIVAADEKTKADSKANDEGWVKTLITIIKGGGNSGR